MTAKLCTRCDAIAVPKTYTPSRFKTEATVWLVFVGLGIGIGLFSPSSVPDDLPNERQVQSVRTPNLSSAITLSEERPQGSGPVGPAERNVTLRIAAWLGIQAFRFVMAFWWVLIVPVGFSVWRQLAKYPGCRDCGSKQLVEVPHDLW